MSQSIKNEYAVFLKARDKNLPAVITNKEEGNLLIKYLNLTPDSSQAEGLDIYTDSADNQGKTGLDILKQKLSEGRYSRLYLKSFAHFSRDIKEILILLATRKDLQVYQIKDSGECERVLFSFHELYKTEMENSMSGMTL